MKDRTTSPGIPADPPAPPADPMTAGSAETARQRLLDLRRRAAGWTAPETPGRYSFIHTRSWSLDDGTDRATTVDGSAGTVNDERLWRADDRSGRRITTQSTAGRTALPHVEDFAAGELPAELEVPSPDPARLAEQMTRQQPAFLGATGRLRAVADLNTSFMLDTAHRVAVLAVLADTTGITYRGAQRDRHQRPGIAFSADLSDREGGTVRDTLIFHPETGELLSHERTGWAAAGPATGAVPVTTDYQLFLERRRTDRIGA